MTNVVAAYNPKDDGKVEAMKRLIFLFGSLWLRYQQVAGSYSGESVKDWRVPPSTRYVLTLPSPSARSGHFNCVYGSGHCVGFLRPASVP